jgi:translocation and assembly module TamA
MEARYAVTPKIGLVGFYDIGQVSADASFGSNAQWHAGAGLGVRYETGIGPIRLDLGTPASGTNVAGNLQVYIGIGQSF